MTGSSNEACWGFRWRGAIDEELADPSETISYPRFLLVDGDGTTLDGLCHGSTGVLL